MALNAYLTIRGEKSGTIQGSVTQKGREGKIAVIAVSHSIVSPRDPQSGLPTGQRMHKPFVFTKELDKSTPILYQALCTNENLREVRFEFWSAQTAGRTGVGAEVQHYTVKLTDANIASIDFRQLNVKDPELARFAEYEEIALTYRRIEWTWTDGGVTAMDDWADRT